MVLLVPAAIVMVVLTVVVALAQRRALPDPLPTGRSVRGFMRQMRTPRNVAVLTLIALFVLVGLIVIGAALLEGIAAVRSTTWPPTEAQVLASHVRGDFPYSTTIQYQYAVDGEPYRGERGQFGMDVYLSFQAAWQAAERYQPGETVIAYVNPEEAGQSVLRPGLTWGTAGMLAAGVILITAGAAWLVFGGVFPYLRGEDMTALPGA